MPVSLCCHRGTDIRSRQINFETFKKLTNRVPYQVLALLAGPLLQLASGREWARYKVLNRNSQWKAKRVKTLNPTLFFFFNRKRGDALLLSRDSGGGLFQLKFLTGWIWWFLSQTNKNKAETKTNKQKNKTETKKGGAWIRSLCKEPLKLDRKGHFGWFNYSHSS